MIHLLCQDCEQRLNKWETPFHRGVFLPLHEGKACQVQYGDWFLKFAVSVSWRVLTLHMREGALSHLTPELQRRAADACETWKDFMLGHRSHPGQFEQHMLPLGEVDGFTGPDVPPNLNRYLLRSVDPRVYRIKDRAFVYSKMCHFVLIGFINMPHPRRWQGTKVHVRHGTFGGRGYSVPNDLWAAIKDGALRVRRHERSISERQSNCIEEAYRGDMERFERSETFRATDQDVKLFGPKTFHFDPDCEEDGNASSGEES